MRTRGITQHENEPTSGSNRKSIDQSVETALEKERDEDRLVLLPIRIDEAVMDSQFGWVALLKRTRHVGDFSRWQDEGAYGQALARLLRDLSAGG